ncbi:hypothetical protein K435DRAFT_447651 [Dendrothele bispora CBS 962.96]|uniref:Uncharacterized protein n=1 Tax=Dendrothele bispora (strain CBS 962.96) TaxID=1314807 RepID=A0A4S8L3D7_DENBC|nr:hypothetical protein K435DRAFT_447651 [Dendrothele bispora CBS 962.96]
MSIIVFSLASTPLITVYLCVILGQSSDDPTSPNSSNSQSLVEDTKIKIISRAILAITVLVTLLAMWYTGGQTVTFQIGCRAAQPRPRIICSDGSTDNDSAGIGTYNVHDVAGPRGTRSGRCANIQLEISA